MFASTLDYFKYRRKVEIKNKCASFYITKITRSLHNNKATVCECIIRHFNGIKKTLFPIQNFVKSRN